MLSAPPLRRGLLISILAIGVLSAGCSIRVLTDEQKFKVLFEGFELLAVQDAPKEGSREADVGPSSLESAYPLEAKLIPGRLYIFRKTNHSSDEALALRILPSRLSRIGARITKQPHSVNDMIKIMVGGPIFSIEFEMDGHVGRIFNREDVEPVHSSEQLIVIYR